MKLPATEINASFIGNFQLSVQSQLFRFEVKRTDKHPAFQNSYYAFTMHNKGI